MRGGARTLRVLETGGEIARSEVRSDKKPKPRNMSNLSILWERLKMLRGP